MEDVRNNDFSDERLRLIEEEIEENQRKNDFDITDFPIEVIVSKFTKGLLDSDKAELFIPDYQREYIWDKKKASEFIESLILDLPVPYIYVAVVNGGPDDGRLEIVDGSQRIRTLVAFLTNALKLEGLGILKSLNGAKFEDMPYGRQLRFKRKSIRWIELVKISEEDRRELFRRVNTGGVSLQPMEIRFGSLDGKLLTLINELAESELFIELCPISETKEKLKQRQEMVLRFFAYRLDFDNYKKEVSVFLDEFMRKVNEDEISYDKARYKDLFEEMLNFVKDNFNPLFFKKSKNNFDVPKIRFEAMSLGVSFALQEDPNASCENIDWIFEKTFLNLTRSDASNSRPKLIDRTTYVKNMILGLDWEATSSSYSLGNVTDD